MRWVLAVVAIAGMLGTAVPGATDAGQVRSPAVRWRFRTSAALTAPVHVAGTLYVGGADGFVYAVEAATGYARWGTNVGTPVATSIAVEDDTVYLANGDFATLDAGSGEELLRLRSDRYRLTELTVADGVVYGGGAVGGAGFVSAQEVVTGSGLWRRETTGIVGASPTVTSDAVYVGTVAGDLYAFDRTEGTVRWQVAAVGGVVGSPVVAAGTVYAGTRGRATSAAGTPTAAGGALLAVDAATGRARWRVDLPVRPEATPVSGAGLVVVAGGGLLAAYDAASGALRWSVHLGERGPAAPVIGDGEVYAVAETGDLVALSEGDGTEGWRLALPEPATVAPVFAEGVVYVAAGRSLYAVAVP